MAKDAPISIVIIIANAARELPPKTIRRRFPPREELFVFVFVILEDDDSVDEGASRDYVKPVQEENALLESETFSTVLKAGFAAFCLVCVLLVFKLAGPVVNEMVSTFPGASR